MKRKQWKRTVGAYGHKVTLVERSKERLSLRWWEPGRNNWRWRSLGHGDRDYGLKQARELSAMLLTTSESLRTERPTIGWLLARYEEEVSRHKKGQQPKEDRRRIDLWTSFLGSQREVRTVDYPLIDRFVRDRRKGLVVIPGRTLSPNPSDTTIGADIIFLQAVLNWATRLSHPDGTPVLARSPLRGYPRPKNKNPRRPVVDHDRFELVRAKADEIDRQDRFGWFMDIQESTGWRVSAICQLRVRDFDPATDGDAPFGRAFKRGETDKVGVEEWVPISEQSRRAFETLIAMSSGADEAPLFPAPRNPSKPWSRFHPRDLLERAESRAGLAPVEGGDFYPYRRKWATERKHLPDKDVAAAGGWRDLRSLQQCYQSVDGKTLFTVVTEPRRLRKSG